MERTVRVQFTEHRTIPTKRGRLNIAPGVLVGTLHLKHFTSALHADPMGITAVGLRWLNPRGIGCDYSALVDIRSLLPGQRLTRISRLKQNPAWDYANSISMDTRSDYSIPIENQPPLVGRWKYTTITQYFYISESDFLLRLKLNTDDPRADRGFIVLEYTLPIDVLLWRKAPRLLPDEVLPEEESWVDVQELSTAVPDLPTSPVWIES